MIAPICFSTFIRYHISADHRSLPAAHHEEVCEGLSSYRVGLVHGFILPNADANSRAFDFLVAF